MEEEELYDDCLAVAKPATGLSAIKSRFENPTPANKPSVGTKPILSPKSAGIAAKFSGAPYSATKPVGGVTGPDKVKPGIKPAKPETANGSSDVSVRDTPVAGAPSLTKRNSKVNIPAAFQQGVPPPPLDQKPQTPAKPVTPKWKQKQDDSNNNKDTVTNSNVSNSSSTMIDKEPKPSVLPKKPIATPTGNVKERANALFGGASPTDLKSALKPVSSNTNKPGAAPKRIGVNTGSGMPSVELRARFGQQIKAKRKSVKSIVRSKDNRKFHKVEVEDIPSDSTVPDKPSKLDTEIDWEQLATDFKKLVKDFESSTDKSGVEEIEEEEEYDDIANVIRRSDRAPSVIQPLTEDEEREWQAAGFVGLDDSNDSLPPYPSEGLEPQEEYDDVGILVQNGQPEDDEELYEPLPDEEDFPAPPGIQPKSGGLANETGKPPPPPPVEQKDKKDQKESEKERKKREREEKEKEKKKEKELKKRQDDLKNLMSKYKIDAQGLTQSVGKGTVRKSVKGTKKDLAVQQGDKVDIIRMVDNDKGKWLVRIINTEKDDKHSSKKKPRRTVGYVESTNVEVDTDIIRDVMDGSYAKQKSSTSSSVSLSVSEGDEEGETYEELDGENGPDLIEEEIYEECN